MLNGVSRYDNKGIFYFYFCSWKKRVLILQLPLDSAGIYGPVHKNNIGPAVLLHFGLLSFARMPRQSGQDTVSRDFTAWAIEI